nr:IS30 family transposase [Vulgatibacter incomptus]
MEIRSLSGGGGRMLGEIGPAPTPQDGRLGPSRPTRSEARPSVVERAEVSRGIQAGESFRKIATRIGRAPSTVSREVRAAGGREAYRAHLAEKGARQRARRPKPFKLVENALLRQAVEDGLRQRWSPQQIAAMLKVDHPKAPELRVSHETIYISLFVQARGALRNELATCLRTGRTRRHPGKRTDLKGKISDMVMISERPAEADDRAVPGHWEGDLIIGKDSKSAIGTLVERKSRFVVLFPLPNGRTAEEVRKALVAEVRRLPECLRRSITWDQGKEMAQHARFSVETNVSVYFCDPHSPWQRGSNENTNGLLRQYFPKGKDLSTYTRRELNTVAAQLNGRPRQTLDWRTPGEVFSTFVASIA